MPRDFDYSAYTELLREAKIAFLADSAYAIAIAKPAGQLVSRQKRKESDEQADSDV